MTLNTLPSFNTIQPETIVPQLTVLLKQNRAAIDALVSNLNDPTWDNLILPLDEWDAKLHHYWAPIAHLHAVKDSPALRDAYNESLLAISEYSTALSHHEGLFRAIQKLAKSPHFDALSISQKTVIEHNLRDFRLSGIDLSSEQKKKYGDLQQELTKLESQFEQHLLDSTDQWVRHVIDPAELEGLPEYALEMARNEATTRQLEGFIITLKAPMYLAMMQYAKNRNLREEMYTAYITRAADIGPQAGRFDNSNIMVEILKKRTEIARLLNFKNYAELSLATKMTKKTDDVLDFLKKLTALAKPAAQKEAEQLKEFAKQQGFKEELKSWDTAYYAEQLRQSLYQFSQEELRPYFQLERVLKGLFDLVQQLFGIQIQQIDSFERWHDDVRFFEIKTNNGELKSYFYLDLFAREKKRSGAWMDECRVQRRNQEGEIEIPIAFLTCNFTPPAPGQTALLDHDEIQTLFHEFGHGLHHMLTQINEAQVSGINGVAWDAVELPSQFMENWCWQPEILKTMSQHIDTSETIPDDLIHKLITSKNFHSALQLLRQNEFALFDFEIHLRTNIDKKEEIQTILDHIRQETAVFKPAPFNRFQHSFSHIFAGGYAAGYYSYKWAEVLASDAFARFEEEGLFTPQVGYDFLHHILERGGSEEAMNLFIRFRGRKPEINALLRHTGISEHTA